MLDQEARALLVRLAPVKPFVLSEPMVLAASLLPAAQIAIERFLAHGRRELKGRIQGFLSWLHGQGGQAAPGDVQHRFVFLKRCGSMPFSRSSNSSIRYSLNASRTKTAVALLGIEREISQLSRAEQHNDRRVFALRLRNAPTAAAKMLRFADRFVSSGSAE
jgi:hypothetical protein